MYVFDLSFIVYDSILRLLSFLNAILRLLGFHGVLVRSIGL